MSPSEIIGKPPSWAVVFNAAAVAGLIGAGSLLWNTNQEIGALRVEFAEQAADLRALSKQVENGTNDRYTGSMALVDKQAAQGVHEALHRSIESLTKRLELLTERTNARNDAITKELSDLSNRVTHAERDHERFRRFLPMDVPR